MKCQDGSECRAGVPGSDLSAYHDDELDPVRRLEIERHLAGCGPCRETLHGIRTVSGWVRALALRLEPAALSVATPRRGGPRVSREDPARGAAPGGRVV